MSTLEGVALGSMRADDWEAVGAIYAHGIATRNATFETEVPTYARWNHAHLSEPRLVARLDDAIVGWAALAPVSERCVYGGVAEDSVYVAEEAQGRGVGRALLRTLVERAEDAGIWTVQTGIFPENVASVQLHLRCGFRIVGRRERLAQLDGAWRDVLFLERRSARI